MIFRAHTRLPIDPHWYDVGFRGTVRLEDRTERFWLDLHRDVGDVTNTEDPRRLILVSYWVDEPPVAAAAVITAPPVPPS